ncbi:MAG: DUF167 family protein [Candidatus Thiodiazotropha sp.]|nr:YggU family protein [Candidatus Thiodiazotropha taylori]MBT3059620.1 YggU family protein [Candidatus Thiodiazotropha sp. (ex Lucina pensylvanica)]MBV2096805.1 YggU family protein [Candidatus Thiodiazotropha sp. (ex Codakia orbicularis)]PUB76804.1 MAG: YggU family protein [gamma proteobacterium symbiont of Ctena orbiculata]MBT3063368.1 YggU family protein [Candidatus Thiodiazotropha sp. (ex Lucina pensylvanica)]
MNWYRWDQDDLILNLRIQPKASRDAFLGPYGENAYKVAIATPPVDGKANARLLKFIAKAFGLPLSQVELVSGKSSRSKRLRLKSPRKLPIEFEN